MKISIAKGMVIIIDKILLYLYKNIGEFSDDNRKPLYPDGSKDRTSTSVKTIIQGEYIRM